MALRDESCIPCRDGGTTLSHDELVVLREELPAWEVQDGHHLHKKLVFPNFTTALAWINAAAAICEAQGHHADFGLGWGYVTVDIYTHKVDGLTRSDAVLAAKLDTIAQ